jgi:segregation and condensation protein B
MKDLKPILEALIFVSDSPVTFDRLRETLPDREAGDIRAALNALVEEYNSRDSGLYIAEVSGGYQIRTRESVRDWIRRLRKERPLALSRAAVETLAVIAYRQPVMKSDIEKVRGVDSSGTLKSLIERNLVRMVGRKDVPGKPILYGTTRKFLEFFHLRDLSELPTLRDWKELGE